MKIETKFNVGDSVVLIHLNSFLRKDISRIQVEINPSMGMSKPLVTYYFTGLSSENAYSDRNYRYEDEIAATKEELAAQTKEC